MYGTMPCLLWTKSPYVGIDWCAVEVVGVIAWFRYANWLQSHNHVMYNATTMAMAHGFALILILDEYVERNGVVLAVDEQFVR